MKIAYNRNPEAIVKGTNRKIAVFSTDGENIDTEVVKSFGDEWLKFHEFSDKSIEKLSNEYFDVLNDSILNKQSYVLDIGCGTGRWTKSLAPKAGFIEAIDPSDAIFAADKLLNKIDNVRLSKASVETIPFDDNTFDFAMSIGVLHHIPNTQQAMKDCVRKVKKGGYFYCYLYYNLETRGWWFKTLFGISDLIRKVVSKLPSGLKKFICDILTIVIYMPLILWVRFLVFIGLRSVAKKMPLSAYNDKSFFVIRNDALDRFGTKLEHRFSKAEVLEMMENCGLTDIVISPLMPYYHAIGKKI